VTSIGRKQATSTYLRLSAASNIGSSSRSEFSRVSKADLYALRRGTCDPFAAEIWKFAAGCNETLRKPRNKRILCAPEGLA
jgi:hypothetical protein